MKKEKIRGEVELQFVFTPLLYLASIGAAQRVHILWSVFSYLELWAFLSGSTLCPTDLTLNVRWAKHLTYGCVQFSQLQQFTLGSKHSLIDIGPKVRSLSVLILQPIRTSCSHTLSDFGYLLMKERKGRQTDRWWPKGHRLKPRHVAPLYGQWRLNNLQKSPLTLRVHFALKLLPFSLH